MMVMDWKKNTQHDDYHAIDTQMSIKILVTEHKKYKNFRNIIFKFASLWNIAVKSLKMLSAKADTLLPVLQKDWAEAAGGCI
jgi:hypothetical protein